jgi:hypothetical protein
VVPTLYHSDQAVVRTGEDTKLVLSGVALTNSSGGALYQSEVRLTSADGSSTTLKPDQISERSMSVGLPPNMEAGNYRVQAVKSEGKQRFASNPIVVSVVPDVEITGVNSTPRGTVIITGKGFSGYVAGSRTSLQAKSITGWRRSRRTSTEDGRILSWSDTRIVASFRSVPGEVTINSVFGQATAKVPPAITRRRGR